MKQEFHTFNSFYYLTQFIQKGLSQDKFRVVSMISGPTEIRANGDAGGVTCEYGVLIELTGTEPPQLPKTQPNKTWQYITTYRDGGTEEYHIPYNGKRYFVDGRTGSKTLGKIFDRYPGDKDAKIVDNLYLGHYKMPAPTKG